MDMNREKHSMVPRGGLKVRRNCFVAFLMSLAMLISGCGEAGSIFHGNPSSEKESIGSWGAGELIVKAESGDEDSIYVAEKAEDRMQVSKEHFVWGVSESGTPWGIDGEGTVWGRDSFPEGIDTKDARTVSVSGEEICVLYWTQSDEILVTDSQGQRKGSIDFGGATVENMVSGDYAIYRFGDGIHVGVCPLDIKNLKKGEDLYPLPEDTRGLLAKGNDGENLYLYTEETVYRYSLKEGICYAVFSWVETGLTGGSVNTVWKEGDDYYAIVYEGFGKTTYRISRKSRDELPKKKEIVIASLQSDPDLSKLVVDFNKAQDEYHVTVRLCQEDGSVTEWEDAYTRLNASLLGTDPPDLLYLDNIWYGDDLAVHGYLEDLKPFLASSEQLGMDDFYPELISYGTCGDVLYTIPYDFWFDTIKVLTADWDGSSGWTYAQMLEHLKERSEYDNIRRSLIILKLYFLEYTIDYFVDEERGEADFDSPEFLELLAYMKDCMEKEGTYDRDRMQTTQLDYCFGLASFGTQGRNSDVEYTFVGFPSPDGRMRTILHGGLEFAIVSTAGNKEGAWKFMEYILSAEPTMNNHLPNRFLSNRNNMQKFIDKELALYGQEYEEIIDDEGKVILLYSDHSITQAHVENFEKALAAGRKVSAMNMVLGGIVCEEADAYFKGMRSAEEAVEIIQNRVKLYLAENR